MLSFLREKKIERDQNGGLAGGGGGGGGGKPAQKSETYNGVPLEMLVDEPKGYDRGHDSEETGYNPAHIMRYESPNQYQFCEREQRRAIINDHYYIP